MATNLSTPRVAEDDDAPMGFSDLRDKIPVMGLKEYWYPAVLDRQVSARKPMQLKILGEELCLFRGASGKVAALQNACPHRGAFLSKGNCEFKGTVACFYHGFVFDEHGECLAALGEGPKSPMPGQIRARVYPTETHKGIVFVWMGAGAPVPLKEDIPEDFFDDSKMVLAWVTQWPQNWRPCFENSFDSHVRYLHRNSYLLLMKPLYPAAFPSGRPKKVGLHRLMPTRSIHERSTEAQEFFPGLNAMWPRSNRRRHWTGITNALRRFIDGRLEPYTGSPDWDTGQHLPCMVRINYMTYMWTRWAVPIDAQNTRMFYCHTAIRRTTVGRVYEWLSYHLFHHWVMDRNFSAQDAPAAIHAYYDKPEYLAPTDAQLVGWRKFLLTARGMPGHQPPQGRN
jgi:nitrite reductase/ring-hydroxylating ferredoxin subunit